VVKKHGKKTRAKKRSHRTGAAHASAAASTTHTHTPLPDMDVLSLVPHGDGRVLDLGLAARLVAACRAGCGPCQKSLSRRIRQDRPTLAALVGVVFGTLPTPGMFASATTREWAPLARAAKADNDGAPAFAAVEAMTDQQIAELLEDALDHWAAGGATEEQIADMIKVITPEDLGITPEDAADAADPPSQIELVPNAPGGPGKTIGGGDYALHLGLVEMPDGRPLPLIALESLTEGAGLDDLRDCRWQPWNGRGSSFPEMDFNWRIRVGIGAQALEQLAHTDGAGFDDVQLWRGQMKLPDDWWNLFDAAGHALLCGPLSSPDPDPDAIRAAAAKGELLAVIGRGSFL
jgi:hypothetical protein